MVTSIETVKYFRKRGKAFHKTQHTRERGMRPDEWQRWKDNSQQKMLGKNTHSLITHCIRDPTQ